MRVGGAVLGLWLVVLTSLVAPSLAAEEAPVVPLPAKLAKELQPLGAGVVGAALAAHPITDPSRLRHVDPGVWVYEVVEGPRDGQLEQVTVSKEGRTDEGENVKLVFGSSGEVQHLEVRYDHVVAKRSQLDAGRSGSHFSSRSQPEACCCSSNFSSRSQPEYFCCLSDCFSMIP